MNSKKENFEINLKVKDKDGKIINLNKRIDLEVNWKERRLEVPKEVVFEKDGEEYRIIITKLEVWQGWLKKKTGLFNWKVSPNSSYDIYHGEPSSSSEPITTKKSEEKDYYIKFTSPWRTGVILVTSLIIVIAFIIGIFLW